MEDSPLSEAAPKPTFWQEFSEYLRTSARIPLRDPERVKLLESMQINEDRGVILALQIALWDAIREEWYNAARAAGLSNELAGAKKIMASDGYDPEKHSDPIVGMPGAKPYVCKVVINGAAQELTCFDMSLGGALPLSAYYTDRVKEAIDIAAMVGELAMKNAQGGAPDGGNTKLAGEPGSAVAGDAAADSQHGQPGIAH